MEHQTSPSLIRTGGHLGLAALLAMLLGACVVHPRPAPRPYNHPHVAKVVVIQKGHSHSRVCGHYRHHGKWYFLKGHVHRHGCGHAFVRGVWIRR